MYYYAFVDSSNTVTGVYALPSQITADGYIAITEQQYNDSQAGNENSLIGKVYNPETGEFEAPIPWSGTNGVSPTVAISKSGTVTTITINDVNGTHTATINDGADGASGTEITASQVLEKLLTVDGQNSGLDADKLDGHDTDYFATATQLEGKANADHNHDTAYAPINHSHNGYAASDHTHTGYAAETHTHSMDDVTGLASALSGKASTDHSHSGYASTNHTHSEYAGSSHTHTTFSSAVNVNGAIKSNGVQVGYNSGTDTTLGSNSYPTIVAGTYTTLNGEKTYAPNIYPRNTGTFYLGAQSNRWSGIYSKVAVNVSSDRRLKENITPIDSDEAEKLINGLNVCKFNYIGSDDKNVGVIAQDILEISPELAETLVTQGDDGYYGVKTSDIVFPLIAYVQLLTKRIEALENK